MKYSSIIRRYQGLCRILGGFVIKRKKLNEYTALIRDPWIPGNHPTILTYIRRKKNGTKCSSVIRWCQEMFFSNEVTEKRIIHYWPDIEKKKLVYAGYIDSASVSTTTVSLPKIFRSAPFEKKNLKQKAFETPLERKFGSKAQKWILNHLIS